MNKKILIIINNLGRGGAERLVVDDINEMLRRGLDIKLITLKSEKRASFKENIHISKNDWVTIPFSGLFDLKRWFLTYREIKKYRPDIVFTHLWFANTVGRLTAYFAGVPMIISFEHGLYDDSKNRKIFLADRVLQHFCSKIVAVSSTFKKVLIERGIKEYKIHVVLNAIEVERYQSATQSNIRKDLGIGNQFIFLSIGSFRPKHKKMDTLIKAFSMVGDGVLVIAGDGSERSYLENLIKELGVEDKVFLLGNRNDIPELLKSADCFVFISRYEGFGIVVIEAMAAGLPVIVSDHDVIKEIIKDGVDGLIVKSGDILETSDTMKEIMLNENKRRALASKAAVSVERFSIPHHVDMILELLK